MLFCTQNRGKLLTHLQELKVETGLPIHERLCSFIKQNLELGSTEVMVVVTGLSTSWLCRLPLTSRTALCTSKEKQQYLFVVPSKPPCSTATRVYCTMLLLFFFTYTTIALYYTSKTGQITIMIFFIFIGLYARITASFFTHFALPRPALPRSEVSRPAFFC